MALARASPCDRVEPELRARCARTLRMVERRHPELMEAVSGALLGATPAPRALVPSGPSLSVVTLNLGLLNLMGVYSVPHAEVRRDALRIEIARILTASSPVAMVLQECYLPADRALVTEAATDAGYDVVEAGPAKSGLVILARREGVRDRTEGFVPLQGDAYRIAGFVRGILWVRLTLGDGTDLVVTNVHLTPLSTGTASWHRTRETLDLLALAERRAGPFACLAEGCSAVMAGDYNFAPEHRWDTTGPRVGEPWLTWDHTLYDLLAIGADGEAGADGWSLDAKNPIWPDYPLADGEPSRRVDLLYVRNAVVEGSELVMAEPVAAGFPVSDHYGVRMRFRPARRE